MKNKIFILPFLILFSAYLVSGQATGGTITYDGDYTIHTFTSNGIFSVTGNLNVSVLVVAGGGGSSNLGAGGGGAGGLIYNTSYAASGNITVIVGNGGAGGQAAWGENGSNSSFAELNAAGGGGGGSSPNNGIKGGSGGGCGSTSTSGLGGLFTTGQGYPGGNCSGGSPYGGGGGGGAGGTGTNGAGGTPGNGGPGINYSINGSTVCYAGGGGGAAFTGSSGTASCGGGAGNSGGSGAAGIDGTGGGGGGAGNNAAWNGGAGGKGVVIVRYYSIKTQTVNLLNTYDNSTINIFQCSAKNSSGIIVYANASSGSAIFQNLTGLINFNCTIPGYYETPKSFTANITGSAIITNYSIESEFLTTGYYGPGTGTVMVSYNASLPKYTVKTLTQFATLITNSQQQTITGTKAGFLDTSVIATAPGGNITPVELHFYDYYLTLFANNSNDGTTLTSFNVTITNLNTSFVQNFSTTNGSIVIPVIKDNYLINFSSIATESANKTLTISANTNYTFSVRYVPLLVINIFDEQTGSPLNNSVDVSLFNANVGTFNYSILISQNIFNLSAGTWIITATAPGYATRNYYLTTDLRSVATQNIYMLNSSADESKTATITIQDERNNLLQGVILTLYKTFNLTSIATEQETTDGTGKVTMQLDNIITYSLTISAPGYQTKTTTIKAITDSTGQYRYIFVITSASSTNFTTALNDYSYFYNPNSTLITAGPNTFSFTTASPSGAISYFGLTANGTTVNYTAFPQGGTASISLDLTTLSNIPVTFFAKSMNTSAISFTILYTTQASSLNASGSASYGLDYIKENYSIYVLNLLSVLGILVLTVISYFVFENINPYTTSYNQGVVVLFGIIFFIFIGWLNPVFGWTAIVTILLMYGFFTVRREEIRGY